ncbi:MAG: hypothetical protein LBC52_02565 [Treponema sp.]|nr:hypothetical protein [Treponema sp.]
MNKPLMFFIPCDVVKHSVCKVNPSVRGITARKGFKTMVVDDFSAEYITSKALATRQTPDEIIHELVSKEIAASA